MEAGGEFKAFVYEYGVNADPSGQIVLYFDGSQYLSGSGQPMINGIEIVGPGVTNQTMVQQATTPFACFRTPEARSPASSTSMATAPFSAFAHNLIRAPRRNYIIDSFGNTQAGAANLNPYDYHASHGYWSDVEVDLPYVRDRWLNPRYRYMVDCGSHIWRESL